MKEIFFSVSIARMLSEVWTLHKQVEFRDYLLRTCGTFTSTPAAFQCIYISQAEDGDIPNDILRSARQWWRVDDTGVRYVPRPDLPSLRDLSESGKGVFFKTPVIRFHFDGCDILIGESYGPELFSRKIGTLQRDGDAVTLTGARVVRTYHSL